MRALLLAGGLGTRLRPVTDAVPKCLVPIQGRALLDYWLELLFAADVERVLINTHHLADAVRGHVERSPWRSRIDLAHEPQLLGTGGTVVANRDWLGRAGFLVAHADNLTDMDAAAFARAHAARPPECVISMLTFQTDDPRSCGILELDGRDVVQAFHEKVENPPGLLANAAVYMMEPQAADFAAALPGPFVDLSTQVIPHFIGRILAVRHGGYHRDIGNLHSLALARAEFRAPRPGGV